MLCYYTFLLSLNTYSIFRKMSLQLMLCLWLFFAVCTSPKVYHSCLCHKTCEDMANANFTCPTACQAGCDCPTGTVNNNGKCVPATDCPCYYQPLGKFFKVSFSPIFKTKCCVLLLQRLPYLLAMLPKTNSTSLSLSHSLTFWEMWFHWT